MSNEPPKQLTWRTWSWASAGCVLLLMPAIAWLWLDHAVWDWDCAEYGYFGIDLWRTLWTQPKLFPWMFFHGVGPKAPLMIWLGGMLMPLRHVMGGAQGVFMGLVLLFQAGALLLTWRCVLEVSRSFRMAWMMTILFSGMPLFVGLSHFYMTEPMQLFSVCLVWLLALCGHKWGVWKLAGGLLWAGALVLGAKASTPIYCLVPGICALWWLWRAFRKKRWGWNGWNGLGVLTGGGALIIIGLWYVVDFSAMLAKVRDASFSEAAYRYGYADTFANKLLYWGGATWRSLTLPGWEAILLTLLLVMMAWIGGASWSGLTTLAKKRRGLVVCLAVLQAGLTYAVLAKNISTPVRYAYALLPTLVLGWTGLFGCAPGRPRTFACCTGLAAWWGLGLTYYLGWLSSPAVASARWWHAPERDGSHLRQVEGLVETLNVAEYDDIYHLCGVSCPWLSGSTLNYYAALRSLDTDCRTQFGRLGNAPVDPEAAWTRVHGELGSFIALSDSARTRETTDSQDVELEILRRIKEDGRFILEDHPEWPDLLLFRNKSRNAEAPHAS